MLVTKWVLVLALHTPGGVAIGTELEFLMQSKEECHRALIELPRENYYPMPMKIRAWCRKVSFYTGDE